MVWCLISIQNLYAVTTVQLASFPGHSQIYLAAMEKNQENRLGIIAMSQAENGGFS